MLKDELYIAIAKALKAMASPARLKILHALAERESACLSQLQPLFSLDKSTLSRHIAALKNAGVVSEKRDGKRVCLSLATPCILNIFSCVGAVLQKEAKRSSRLSLSDGTLLGGMTKKGR